MSARELIILGTSSQVPTPARNHLGCFVRFGDCGFLFDPGEGAQRQMILAGVRTSQIDHICVTHFHRDHCLGLPGLLQRISLDGTDHAVHVHYPGSGEVYCERLELFGVRGPDVGRLQREGRLRIGGQTVELTDASELRRP